MDIFYCRMAHFETKQKLQKKFHMPSCLKLNNVKKLKTVNILKTIADKSYVIVISLKLINYDQVI